MAVHANCNKQDTDSTWYSLLRMCIACTTLTIAGTETDQHKRACPHRLQHMPRRSTAASTSAAAAPVRRMQRQPPSAPPPLNLLWTLDAGTAARLALDSLAVDNILSQQRFTTKSIRFRHRDRQPLLLCFEWCLRQLHAAVDHAWCRHSPDAEQVADSWHKLWFLLPTLLRLPDGGEGLSRNKRIQLFHQGDLATLLASASRACTPARRKGLQAPEPLVSRVALVPVRCSETPEWASYRGTATVPR